MPDIPQLATLLALISLLCCMHARAEAPSQAELDALEAAHIIDWHAHVAGLGYGDSGNFINQEMRDNFRFRFFMRWMGVTEEELVEHGDAIVVKRLSERISRSRFVDQAVVLALDGVIDENTGELDRQRTQFHVSNAFVARETARYTELLYGASINPLRPDSIERLRLAKRDGAMLIKWIPSIMHFDPADERLIPFYQEMVALKLPLLTHTGMEKSFASARDELCDPQRLRLPLGLGVTVIAAHIATTGESQGQDNFERILPMFAEYPNLYADISSLTQINKLGYLARALQIPGLSNRMIYGTDWPLQYFPMVSPWYHLPHIGLGAAWRIGRSNNVWDRDVLLKQAFGAEPKLLKRVPDTDHLIASPLP